jgi:methyl-accepting chemotaxis protein
MFLVAIFMMGLGFFGYPIYISNLKENGKANIAEYQKREIEKIKQTLKKHLDMAYKTIESNFKNSQNDAYLEAHYGALLKSIVDVAEGILRTKAGVKFSNPPNLPTHIRKTIQKLRRNGIVLSNAKKLAILEINQLKYGEQGYVWINDTSPRMIMHPKKPHLNGEVLGGQPEFNTTLAGRQNIFEVFVAVTKKEGEGFVKYLWDKPTGKGKFISNMPKLSYVRLFKEWNWIIGTGIYLDEVFQQAMEKSKNDLKQMRYDNGTGYIWINDTRKPTPRMVMHPTLPHLDQKILDNPKFNSTLGKYTQVEKNQNLFKTFVEVCEEEGEGFVDYKWAKQPIPGKKGLTIEQSKLSYVKLFKPDSWTIGWIIGTGVYIDYIEKEVAKREQAINEQINRLGTQIMVVASIIIIILIILIIILLFLVFKHFEKYRRSS